MRRKVGVELAASILLRLPRRELHTDHLDDAALNLRHGDRVPLEPRLPVAIILLVLGRAARLPPAATNTMLKRVATVRARLRVEEAAPFALSRHNVLY